MRYPDDTTKLDYARPVRRFPSRSMNAWGWFGVFGGMITGFVGFRWAVSLENEPVSRITEMLAIGLFIGGAGMCLTGIALIAIAASRPN